MKSSIFTKKLRFTEVVRTVSIVTHSYQDQVEYRETISITGQDVFWDGLQLGLVSFSFRTGITRTIQGYNIG
jgi:hypothetical protein